MRQCRGVNHIPHFNIETSNHIHWDQERCTEAAKEGSDFCLLHTPPIQHAKDIAKLMNKIQKGTYQSRYRKSPEKWKE